MPKIWGARYTLGARYLSKKYGNSTLFSLQGVNCANIIKNPKWSFQFTFCMKYHQRKAGCGEGRVELGKDRGWEREKLVVIGTEIKKRANK
jgi:hypothetical protein